MHTVLQHDLHMICISSFIVYVNENEKHDILIYIKMPITKIRRTKRQPSHDTTRHATPRHDTRVSNISCNYHLILWPFDAFALGVAKIIKSILGIKCF